MTSKRMSRKKCEDDYEYEYEQENAIVA